MSEIKTPKPFSYLTAISSIDGRFRGRVENYSLYFSEFATIKNRVFVEIEYLIAFLSEIRKPVPASTKKMLRGVALNFNEKDALWICKKDEEINHDTKAVEYFLSNKLTNLKLQPFINYLHIGLTSTDIDNTGLSISLKNFVTEVLIPRINGLIGEIDKIAKKQKDVVMPARTHGQIAVPTTAGMELKKFTYRLKVQLEKLSKIKIGSKIGGAIGNHNALTAAYPNINWPKFSKKFVNSLDLEYYPFSTQVEPYEHKVEFIQAVKRVNLVIIALNEDIWRYLALGYLSLRDDKGHVGSSTMPQKINPIGFEMSESYLSLSNGIFDVMEKRLPLNRWQRDLTDKYLLRDLGQALVMSALAYESATEGIKQIGFNEAFLETEIDNHWELIAEGVQTILRTTDYEMPYEKLKELTRGKKVTQETYEKFIDDLDIPRATEEKLKSLSPSTYTGLAKK